MRDPGLVLDSLDLGCTQVWHMWVYIPAPSALLSTCLASTAFVPGLALDT